jgi:hypothetical protein
LRADEKKPTPSKHGKTEEKEEFRYFTYFMDAFTIDVDV